MRSLLFVLISAMALTLTACDSSDSKDNKATQNPDQAVNETDYSVCGVTTAPHTIEGRWQIIRSQGDFRLTTTMIIQNSNIQVFNDCELLGTKLRARASAPAYYDNATFQVLQPASDSQRIDHDNFHMSCDVSLEAKKINYSFDGNCLVFTQSGQSERMVLAPF